MQYTRFDVKGLGFSIWSEDRGRVVGVKKPYGVYHLSRDTVKLKDLEHGVSVDGIKCLAKIDKNENGIKVTVFALFENSTKG